MLETKAITYYLFVFLLLKFKVTDRRAGCFLLAAVLLTTFISGSFVHSILFHHACSLINFLNLYNVMILTYKPQYELLV